MRVSHAFSEAWTGVAQSSVFFRHKLHVQRPRESKSTVSARKPFASASVLFTPKQLRSLGQHCPTWPICRGALAGCWTMADGSPAVRLRTAVAASGLRFEHNLCHVKMFARIHEKWCVCARRRVRVAEGQRGGGGGGRLVGAPLKPGLLVFAIGS